MDRLAPRQELAMPTGWSPITAGWQNCDPPRFAPAPYSEGEFYLHIECERAAPHLVTIRQVVHGVPAADVLTVRLHACPGPGDPTAFAAFGNGLRHATAGEPEKIVVRPVHSNAYWPVAARVRLSTQSANEWQVVPRSFGGARAQAGVTFGGLRGWLEFHNGYDGYTEGDARILPMGVHRRERPPVGTPAWPITQASEV